MTEEVLSEKEQAGQAYRVLEEAIDAAIQGDFPVGLGAVQIQLQVVNALQFIGQQLYKLYPEEDPAHVESLEEQAAIQEQAQEMANKACEEDGN